MARVGAPRRFSADSGQGSPSAFSWVSQSKQVRFSWVQHLSDLRYKDGFTTVHRSARQQAARGAKWVGAAADEQRGVFFAACSNRRLIELDRAGRRVCLGRNMSEPVPPASETRLDKLLEFSV